MEIFVEFMREVATIFLGAAIVIYVVAWITWLFK